MNRIAGSVRLDALTGTLALARADLTYLFDEPSASSLEDFLDCWFAAEAQDTLPALVAKLRSKKSA